eukprot:gnl/TRDRNA2_/TRDRNA2_193580_c0_seq1.p1 gnl/TRDRNA2_/TRDRNA2_193580_c0~~gnl/TRDRNA2_/TRDRNA2_193580_c0_seq1.p1  ORF type:complete len:301 (+),score=44.04 gnl/TRDRNA2_/TRDRNA2_193580_c0_seq1:152-1054(+)
MARLPVEAETRRHAPRAVISAAVGTVLLCLYAIDFVVGGPMTLADGYLKKQVLPFLQKKRELGIDVEQQATREQHAEGAKDPSQETEYKAMHDAELAEESAADELSQDGHAMTKKHFHHGSKAVEENASSGPPWVVCTVFSLFYYCCVVAYSKRRMPEAEDWSDTQITEGLNKHRNDFRWGVTNCTSASCSTVFLACFCLPARAAHTWHSAGILHYWFGFCLVQLCGAVPVVLIRRRLRMLMGLEPRTCADCCTGCFCTPCVVIQEARVVDEVCNAASEEEDEPLLAPPMVDMPMGNPVE